MKILLITNNFDYPISDFIKYLLVNKIEFIRDNGNSIYNERYFNLSLSNDQMIVNYYPGYNIYVRKSPVPNMDIYNEFGLDIVRHITSEIKQLKQDIFRILVNNPRIKVFGSNNFGLNDISKIDVLINAKKIGLNIPETIITTSAARFKEFVKKYTKVVSKPIVNPVFIKDFRSNVTFNMYTEVLTENNMPLFESKSIFPSLVQNYIEKLFEIRVYIIGKKFYPMAIFSQFNTKTQFDFRNHDNQNPNKIVPYKLSYKIKLKLLRLMKLYNMNNASIDLIYSPDNILYFLEINPFGQFNFYTKCCNYFVEKEITSYFA